MGLKLFKKMACDGASGPNRGLRHLIVISVVWALAATQIPVSAASAGNDDATRQIEDARRGAERQQREQERQAREAQKAADQQRHEQEKQAREAQKAADRQRREQEKQAREAQKAAAQQASNTQHRAERQRQIPGVPTSTATQASPVGGPVGGAAASARSSVPSSQASTDGTARDTGSGAVSSPAGHSNRDARETDNRAGRKNEDKQNQASQKNDAPPATMKEWFDRVTKSGEPLTTDGRQNQNVLAPATAVMEPATPAVPTVPTTIGRPVAVAAPASPATAVSPAAPVAPTTAPVLAPEKRAPTAQSNQPVTPLPPIEFPDFKQNEVLAVNASAQSLSDAKALGFTINTVTALASLNLSITKLSPPNGLDAIAAQKLLSQKLPNAEFALNKEYRIYRTATGTAPAQEKSPSRITEAACAGDHCYGRDIIAWHSSLDQCSKGVKIGIIDTSVDTSHPVFAHRKIEIRHTAGNGRRGPNWHGTGVMGLLAGDAPGGVLGLAPEAEYSVADAFYAGVDDQPTSDTVSMLRAFDWLEKRNVNIVNMSLSGPADALLKKAIDRLAEKGVIFVAAAGNGGPNAAPSYPAAYENVVAVTAVNKALAGYRHANRGDYVDFAAPGVAVWTAMPGGTGTYHSGTSFAAPFVTAAIASVYQQLPGKTASDVIRAIKVKDLGVPGKDPIYGYGLILAPATCGGSGVASAAANSAASRTSAGAFATATQTQSKDEILPWLGFAPK